VWQWCEDFYNGNNGSRVLRGDSFVSYNTKADDLLSSVRGADSPGSRDRRYGFRVVVAFESKKSEQASAPTKPDLSIKLPATTASQPMVGTKWTIPDLNLDLMPIAPGTFQMGSASGGEFTERPVTRVTITKPYWLGKTEVTQAQWQALMQGNPSKFKGDNLPVEMVNWNEAMDFCRKLTDRERAAGRLPAGYIYSLPTEAQWEYACRAGTTGDFAGNLDAMGWYQANSDETTHPVGQKQANAWGLHDMHGNVSEWCSDWSADYPGGNVTDPRGVSDFLRVNRGGNWMGGADFIRSAVRGGNQPGYRDSYLGFRLALVVQP